MMLLIMYTKVDGKRMETMRTVREGMMMTMKIMMSRVSVRSLRNN